MKEKKVEIKPVEKEKAALKFKLIKNENWQPPRKPKMRIKINREELPPAA